MMVLPVPAFLALLSTLFSGADGTPENTHSRVLVFSKLIVSELKSKRPQTRPEKNGFGPNRDGRICFDPIPRKKQSLK